MEKLVELLNEYELEKDNYSGVISEEDIYYYSVLYISKKFWFIKWLVENDKIDRERINDRWWDMSIHFPDEELFIMSLSISNTPIEDLILYLK